MVTVSVPWAETLSRFTMLFESAVFRLMGLSWNTTDGIMQRAVARGLWRRQEQVITHIGVDETSFHKRHDYMTVVSEQGEGRVLHVVEGRKRRPWRRGTGA